MAIQLAIVVLCMAVAAPDYISASLVYAQAAPDHHYAVHAVPVAYAVHPSPDATLRRVYTHSVPFAYAAHTQAVPDISYGGQRTPNAAPIAYVLHGAPSAPVAPDHSAPSHVVVKVAPAHYNLQYAVEDRNAGDVKSQNDGSYFLIDAEGRRRAVEYTSDDQSDFNRVFHKKDAVVAPVAYVRVVPAFARQAYAAPAAKAAAPLVYASQQY